MNGFLDNMPEVDLPGSARLCPGKPGGQARHPLRGDTVKPKAKQAVINTGDKIRTIIWYVIKCPRCGSTKAPVTKTCRPIRYHKCSDCGYNFKSVEK